MVPKPINAKSRPKILISSITTIVRPKKCPGLDSNQHKHSSPPPQGGVSTNFTTRATLS
jgi:hypothetical protein